MDPDDPAAGPVADRGVGAGAERDGAVDRARLRDEPLAHVEAAGGRRRGGLADADAAEETLQLSNAKSIQDAIELLVKALGMQPLEGSEIALSGSTHSLRLYGKSVSGGKVVGQVRMAYSARSGVTVKISARSEEEGLAALVVGGVA